MTRTRRRSVAGIIRIKMKTPLIITALSVGLISPGSAADTLISWYNSPETELKDFDGIPLVASQFAGPKGDMVELGYYTLATTSDPFAGTWEGFGAATIGDKAVTSLGPGRYSYSASFPAAFLLLGAPLSIRFHDSFSLQTSTYFNAVSDSTGAWNMVNSTNSELSVTLSLSDAALVWQGGSDSAFRTTISIPEPSSFVLLGLGGAPFVLRGRRSARPLTAL